MRRSAQIVFACLSLFIKAQDTSNKINLKLFEINFRMATGSGPEPKINLKKISSFTKHKEFADENFTKRYSDTARRRHFHEWHGPISYSDVGLSASFKFTNTRSKFLKRIRPQFGLCKSWQSIFEYGVGFISRIPIDSLRFVNPTYPTQKTDSVTTGILFYNYTSERFYTELGVNYDLVLIPRFIAYAGFLYGFGMDYNNQFSVNRYERYYIDKSGGNSGEINEYIDTTFTEPNTISSRIVLPVGIHHRLTIKRKYL